MIQRKQTLFIAFAILLLLQLFILPLYSFKKGEEKILFYIYGLRQISVDYFATIALNVLSIFLLLATIFLYKNRKNQMRLCKVSMSLIAGIIAAIFYFVKNAKSLPELAGYTPSVCPVLVAPFGAFLLIFFANRAIRNDEELVRSADRLR